MAPRFLPMLMNPSTSRLSRLADRLDRCAIWSGRLTCLLLIPLVLGLSYEVAARYLFNAPTIWAYDLTFMLYGAFFMLGAAFCLQRRGHVRTDIFYDRLTPRRQAVVDLVGYALFFLPFVYLLVVVGGAYFWKAFVTRETFVTSAWQPLTWPFKLAIPTAGLLLLIQGTAEVLKALYALHYGHWPRSPVDTGR